MQERVEDKVHAGFGRRLAGAAGVGLAVALVLSAGTTPAGASDGTDARTATADTLT